MDSFADLLSLHRGVRIHSLHLPVHGPRRLCLAIGSRRSCRYLSTVHIRVLSIVLISRQVMPAHVISWCHGMRSMICRRGHVLTRNLSLARSSRNGLGPSSGLCSSSLGMRCCLFPGNNINQKVEHVGLGQSRGDVRSLKSTALIFLCVNPSTHREFRDENIAAFGKQYRRFRRDHFHFWVGFHDFFDPSQGKLMDLVVVSIALKVSDGLLPIRR